MQTGRKLLIVIFSLLVFPATSFAGYEELLELLRKARINFIFRAHEPSMACNQDFFKDRLHEFGLATKQLFLVQDKKPAQYFLCVVHPELQVNLKTLGRTLGVGKLKLATANDVERVLGVLPGAVSPFALVSPEAVRLRVRFVIDSELLKVNKRLTFPALRNDMSIGIPPDDLFGFLLAYGYKAEVIPVPYK